MGRRAELAFLSEGAIFAEYAVFTTCYGLPLHCWCVFEEVIVLLMWSCQVVCLSGGFENDVVS